MLKACRRCTRVLPSEAFRPNAKLADGLDSWCRDCHRTAVRVSRAKHGDRYNEQRRGTVRGRRGALRAIDGNPDTERLLTTTTGDPCAYCGGPSNELDHIVPIANGGTDTPDNFAACCTSCNRQKQTTSLLGFLLKRRIRHEIAALDLERAACA